MVRLALRCLAVYEFEAVESSKSHSVRLKGDSEIGLDNFELPSDSREDSLEQTAGASLTKKLLRKLIFAYSELKLPVRSFNTER